MVLAMKRLRLARAEGFAEGLVQALAAKGPEHLAAGLERARIKAVSEGNFDRADALRYMQLRLGVPTDSDKKSLAAELRKLQDRIRQLENGGSDADPNGTHAS